nr:formate dehydrogenase accessory sulfurtransferase FdhD [Sphingomonas xinjiangensis]
MPVAIEYNSIGYGVMMATPADLEAFALGFTLTEGLAQLNEILDIHTHAVEGGIVLRITLAQSRLEPVLGRARLRVSESSCGLCGLDNIAQVLRPLPPVSARITTSRDSIHRALEALPALQPLSAATGAVHAAAFCLPDGSVQQVREDVGRHTALDKLVGAVVGAGHRVEDGFFVLTSRCSYELVEKTVQVGCPLLVTISAPTSLAVERAREADLALVALARQDSMLVMNDPHRSIR